MNTKFLILVWLFFAIAIVAIVTYIWHQSLQPKIIPFTEHHVSFAIQRLTNEPIIDVTIHSRLQEEAKNYGYTNINGPSLIRVPKWVSNPLGNYYLYFAHHKGAFIRMAYADSLTGPWTMYDQEIMPLTQSGSATETSAHEGIWSLKKYMSWSELLALREVGNEARAAWEQRTQQKIKSSPPTTPHVASPEIIIDEKAKKIRLYYHGVVEGVLQMSKVALSDDGLHFQAEDGLIGLPYLRVFPFRNQYYGLAMPGFFYRSKDGLKDFEVRQKWLFDTKVRHSALYQKNDNLYIFYTRVGDVPERILYTRVDMSSRDWNDWKVETPRELMRPELEWEGVNEPQQPSIRGEMGVKVHQLRDPDVFEDEDGRLYLVYAGGGEQGIGIAALIPKL